MTYEFTFSEYPLEEDARAIQDGYRALLEAQIGMEERREIAFFIRDEEGSVVGGSKGKLWQLRVALGRFAVGLGGAPRQGVWL